MINVKRSNAFLWIVVSGVISWFIFLIAFLFLTQSLMFFMDFEVQALIFLVVGLALLFFNYFVFKIAVSSSIYPENDKISPIKTQHEIFSGLDRLFNIIVILVTLGIMSSLITFIFASMTFFNTHDLMKVLELTPVLLVVYLIFIIPCLYGFLEIRKLRTLLSGFEDMKEDMRNTLNLNITSKN
ncbi:MAG: hypothetical protein ACW981_19080 [Candidatus Hodarchaeales archaeon]|jgi:hypothetical protein